MSHSGSRRSSKTGPPTPQQPTAQKTPQQEPFRELRPSEKIPILQSTLPATFIPFNEDFANPPAAPWDRLERLKRILETIDSHRVGVKENILWLFDRERERMIMEGTEKEEGLRLQDDGFEEDDEEDEDLIHNMWAPAQLNFDHDIKEAPPFNPLRLLPPTMSPRDMVINQLLNLFETGTRELGGYDEHIAGIRNFYEECLQKEAARTEEAGRPAKRVKVAEAAM